MTAFILALFFGFVSSQASAVVTVDFSGGDIREIPAVEREGALYVSVRELAGLFSGKLFWAPEKRKLVVNLGEADLVLTADDPYAMAGTAAINLVLPPFLDGGGLRVSLPAIVPWLDTLLPERLVWDREKRTLYVRSGKILIRRATIEEKKNGTVFRLILPDALKFDNTFFRPQLNLNIVGAKISRAEIVSKNRTGLVREVDAVQFESSAQVSLILDDGAGEPEVAYRDNPPRIEVVVRPRRDEAAPALDSPPPHPEAELKKKEKLSKIRTIIIDPGHGGQDPGAQNLSQGVEEKTIALAIGLRLKEKLSENLKDTKVLLTRRNDTFISLKERSRIANGNGGDIFISIHCNSVGGNASAKSAATGFVVYFLDAARDDESRALATLENAVIEFEKDEAGEGVSDVDFIIKSSQLNLYRNESEDLAILLEQELSRAAGEVKRHKTGVNQAGFFVLRGPEMPSVLVETAFISNPREAKILAKENFQEKVAEALYKGVKRFKEKYEGVL